MLYHNVCLAPCTRYSFFPRLTYFEIDAEIDQPTAFDHHAKEEALRREIKVKTKLQNELVLNRRCSARSTWRPLTESQEKRLDMYNKLIPKLENDMRDIGLFSRPFGQLIKCPDTAIDLEHDNIVDWALIRLNERRFNENPRNIVSKTYSTHRIESV